LEESSRKSDQSWCRTYGEAKQVCISLLLDVGHFRTAFALSQKYLHFPGLLASVEGFRTFEQEMTRKGSYSRSSADFRFANSSSKQMFEELRSFVGKHKDTCTCTQQRSDDVSGDHMGNENVKLLIFILGELEIAGYCDEILEFGSFDDMQLMEFLKVGHSSTVMSSYGTE
jgi:hypothetical protein